MNLFMRVFKVLQSCAHAIVSKFEDPIKLTEQGIRDLKKDFDESMKNVAQIKAIAIGAKREIETKKQIAQDYEQKALIILQKAKNNELDPQEADRLASEALKKKQTAMNEVNMLTTNLKAYEANLAEMEKKVLDLKNQIQKWESEYQALKARAVVAKTTKKINKQLSTVATDSTAALLEDMKQKITAEENIAQAYGDITSSTNNIDDEINKAIGTDVETQKALDALKQKLLPDSSTSKENDNLEELKKELE